MSAPRTARAVARAEMTAAIKDEAGRQLADQGAAGLSLRAVARALGMASSAVYRYFASRDDLLTALIVDAYDDLGTAVERADARHRPRDDVTGRWVAACRAVRHWALRNPHQYALIYGSPVPGYRAPADTVGPASRVPVVFAGLLQDALAAGVLRSPPATPPAPLLTPGLAADTSALEPFFGDVPADTVVRSLVAWTAVFGLVTFELFGQYENVVSHRDDYHDHAIRLLADMMGLPAAT